VRESWASCCPCFFLVNEFQSVEEPPASNDILLEMFLLYRL
jgi:hypothetical protein